MEEIKPTVPLARYSLKQLTEILVKEQGLTEGLYDMSVDFQVAVGGVGPSPSEIYPGALIGVAGFGLLRASVEGPHTVNASNINLKANKTISRKKSEQSSQKAKG